jgi:hypothetical protein
MGADDAECVEDSDGVLDEVGTRVVRRTRLVGDRTARTIFSPLTT